MADVVSPAPSSSTVPTPHAALSAPDTLADTGLSNGPFVAPASAAELTAFQSSPPPAAPSVPAPPAREQRLASVMGADLAWAELLEKAGALLETYPRELSRDAERSAADASATPGVVVF